MNYRIIAKMACKLLAIYFLILSMNLISNIFVSLLSYRGGYENFVRSLMLMSATPISFILFTILLWFFADRISFAIIKEPLENYEKKEVEYDKAALIAFTVMGLFVLTKAVPDLVRVIFQLNLQIANQLNFKETSTYIDTLSRMIGFIVQVAMGIWLVIGSKGIIKALSAFRNFGTDRIDVKEE